MNFLKDHALRFGWIYVLLAALIATPQVIWRLNQVPPLDMETVRMASEYQESLRTEQYGPPMLDAFEALWSKDGLDAAFVKDPRVERVVNGMWRVAGEPWMSELDDIRATYGEALEEWDSLDREGVYDLSASDWISLYSTVRAESTPIEESYGNRIYGLGGERSKFLRRRSAWHLALAVEALRSGRDLDAAEEVFRSADVYRPLYANGHHPFLYVSSLNALVDGLSLLIDSQPSSGTIAAIHARIDEALDEAEVRGGYPVQLTVKRLPERGTYASLMPGMAPMELRDSVQIALMYKDTFDRRSRSEAIDGPRLHRWAPERIDALTYQTYRGSRTETWTTTPLEVDLLQTLSQFPHVLASHNLPLGMYHKLDLWTLAAALRDPSGELHTPEVKIRASVALTRLHLLSVAHAARLFREDRGEWPRLLSDLSHDYLDEDVGAGAKPAPDAWKFNSESHPTGPIRMGWIEIDEPWRNEFWMGRLRDGCALEVKDWASLEKRPPLEDRRKIELDDSVTGQPILGIAALSGLNASTLAEASDLVVEFRRPGEGGTRPLDMEWARAVTDAHDREAMRIAGFIELYERGVAHRALSPPAELSMPNPAFTRISLRAKFRIPGPVFAVWSPGPDGIDQHGAIPYSRYNETLEDRHSGDLIAFPEGF